MKKKTHMILFDKVKATTNAKIKCYTEVPLNSNKRKKFPLVIRCS